MSAFALAFRDQLPATIAPPHAVTAISLLVVCLASLAGVVLLLLWTVGREHIWPAVLLIVTAPLEVYRTNAGPFNLSLFRLALAVSLVALTADLLKSRLRGRRLPVVFAVYALLVAWQAVSLLAVSTQPSLGYRFLSQYAAGLLAAFVITRYVRRSDLALVAVAYVASAILPLAASVFRVFSVRSHGSGDLPGLDLLPVDPAIRAARDSGSFLVDGVQRMQGTFSDPNHFGFFVATAAVIALGLLGASMRSWSQGDKLRTISTGAMALACVVGVVGSYSRSAWLLTIVGVLVLFALIGRSVWTPRRALISAGCVTILASLLAPAVVSRINPRDRGTQMSNTQHAQTMRRALELAKDRPLTGVGLGSYGAHAGQPRLVSSAHSTVLTVAAELGLPGVLLLIVAMSVTAYGSVHSVFRRPAFARPVGAGLAAAFIGLATANFFYEVWMDDFQWVLFGLVIAALKPVEIPERRRVPGVSALPAPRPRALR